MHPVTFSRKAARFRKWRPLTGQTSVIFGTTINGTAEKPSKKECDVCNAAMTFESLKNKSAGTQDNASHLHIE
jgi:hypothetical protein